MILTYTLIGINGDASRRTGMIWWWWGSRWASAWRRWGRASTIALAVIAGKHSGNVPIFEIIDNSSATTRLTWRSIGVAGEAIPRWFVHMTNYSSHLFDTCLSAYGADPSPQSRRSFSTRRRPPQRGVDVFDPKGGSKWLSRYCG